MQHHIMFIDSDRETSVHVYSDNEMEELFTEEQRAMLRGGEWIIYTNKDMIRFYPHQVTVVDLVAQAKHNRPHMFK